ncbi:hypothetical protein [Streptomyces sp. NPDC056169]|uniref:hypothetical protein n=1 Tax=Streptomyces sp. NPDC056169 TaxID=3345734 RepID=UPI0035D90FFE
MDPTTVTLVGALLALIGVLATAVVAYVGKRGELSLNSLSTLTDELQEERSSLKEERTLLKEENVELRGALAAATVGRAVDQAEIARLRLIIMQLGGDPG